MISSVRIMDSVQGGDIEAGRGCALKFVITDAPAEAIFSATFSRSEY